MKMSRRNIILVNGKNPNMEAVETTVNNLHTNTVLFTGVSRAKALKLVGGRDWYTYFPRSVKRFDVDKALKEHGFNVVWTINVQSKPQRKPRQPTEQKWVDAGYKKEQASWVNKESDCENGHISVEEHQKIEKYFARLLGYKSGKLPWYVAAKLSSSEILWQAEMGMRDALEDATPSQRNKWKSTPNYYL